MDSHIILWALGALAVIAFGTVLIIQNKKRKLLLTVGEIKTDRRLFSNTDIGSTLNHFLKALTTDDENRFLLLEKLKQNPAACLQEVTDAFEKLNENEYNSKWMIVYCVSQFELPDFLHLLSKIAHTEIPGEKSRDIHLYSTVSEETVIRLRAIDGILKIAKKGYEKADSALFSLLDSKYLTLSIAACQSLIEIDAKNTAKIVEMLPKDKQYIMEIKRKEVKEIAVIPNPERYVKTINKEVTAKPALRGSTNRELSISPDTSKAPKIKVTIK